MGLGHLGVRFDDRLERRRLIRTHRRAARRRGR